MPPDEFRVMRASRTDRPKITLTISYGTYDGNPPTADDIREDAERIADALAKGQDVRLEYLPPKKSQP